MFCGLIKSNDGTDGGDYINMDRLTNGRTMDHHQGPPLVDSRFAVAFAVLSTAGAGMIAASTINHADTHPVVGMALFMAGGTSLAIGLAGLGYSGWQLHRQKGMEDAALPPTM